MIFVFDTSPEMTDITDTGSFALVQFNETSKLVLAQGIELYLL